MLDKQAILLVYVDNMILFAEDEVTKQDIVCRLSTCFSIVDLGQVKVLLGVEFIREQGRMFMSQRGYIAKLGKKFKLVFNHLVKVPVTVGTTLTREPNVLPNDFPFVQYNGAQTTKHVKALLQVLQYTVNTSDYRIELILCTSERLWAYSDAWCPSVACSTMEAEFVALVDCVREVYWLSHAFQACPIFEPISTPSIYADAMSSIQFTSNDVENSHTKHIRIKFHWLRECLCLIVGYLSPQPNAYCSERD
uniref:Reverse transcriptase Ty1/copia-type domain-containing protein n=1 Tax=Strigamia maritima TaxID=126957 RepID=T1IKA6_STRMM